MGNDLSYWGVGNALKKSNEQLDVFTTKDLILAWEKKTGKEWTLIALGESKNIPSLATIAIDLNTAHKMIRELGVTGRISLVKSNGKQIVLLRSSNQVKSIFSVARYSWNNVKLLKMAFGAVDANKVPIANGTILSICFTIPLDILLYLLSDDQTLIFLFGTITSDLIKIALTSVTTAMILVTGGGLLTVIAATGAEAASVVALVSGLAVAPVIVAIVIGVALYRGIDFLDKHYQLTDALILKMEEMNENFESSMEKQIKSEIDTRTNDAIGHAALPGNFYL